MCMVEHDAPAVAFHENTRKARKIHRCYECRNEIRPGERYRYDSGIWDGHPSSFKTCLSCVQIRKWLKDEMAAGRLEPNEHVDECGSWIYGSLGAACEEAFREWKYEHRRCLVHYWIPASAAAPEHQDCESEYV